MISEGKFLIDFPVISTVLGASTGSLDTGFADACSSNSNYYTSGAQRSTCCCDCDKD